MHQSRRTPIGQAGCHALIAEQDEHARQSRRTDLSRLAAPGGAAAGSRGGQGGQRRKWGRLLGDRGRAHSMNTQQVVHKPRRRPSTPWDGQHSADSRSYTDRGVGRPPAAGCLHAPQRPLTRHRARGGVQQRLLMQTVEHVCDVEWRSGRAGLQVWVVGELYLAAVQDPPSAIRLRAQQGLPRPH